MADQDDDEEILYNDPESGTPPATGDQDPAGSGDGGSNSHVGTPQYDSTTTASSGGSTRAVTASAPQPANPEKPLTAADAPQAPAYTAPDRTKLDSDEALYKTDAAPLDRKALAPKWYDRLLGGLSGSSEVTNRKYITAANDQKQRVTADQGNITQDRADMKDEDDLYQHRQLAFDAADRGFNTRAQAQQRTIENQRQVGQDQAAAEERLYEHGRDTKADAFNQQKDSEEQNYRNSELGLRRQEMGQNYGIAVRKLNDDERASAAASNGDNNPAPAAYKADGTADLSNVPAAIRATVQQIGEGRVPAPRRTKQNAAILDAVANAYPDYDASMYPTYAKTRQQFTSGSQAQAINSFNTALTHLGRAEDNAPKNGSVPFMNHVGNAFSRATGSDKLSKFDADRTAVSSEIAKAYKGGVINKEEHDEYQNLLSPDASPAQMKSNFSELRGLLSGKLTSYNNQWEQSMPKGAVKPFNVMSPEASAVMSRGAAPAAGNAGDMVQAQIPGQPAGQIHRSQIAAFKAKYPNAQVSQ